MARYDEILNEDGYLIVSTSTDSMRPLLRERLDSVVLIPVRRPVCAGDVLLFRKGSQVVLHRAISPIHGGWFTRGDNAVHGEKTPDDQIIGVMKGFYRGERYVSAEFFPYRVYAYLIVRLHRVLVKVKWIARRLRK